MSKSSSGFGRDEMSALLGGDGGMSETPLFRKTNNHLQVHSGGNKPNAQGDFANLSTAQAAAILKEREALKSSTNRTKGGGVRLRAVKTAGKSSERETLLLEQQQERDLDASKRRKESSRHDETSSEDEEDGFIRKKQERQQSRRRKMEPTVVRAKTEPQVVVRRRRRRADSSSDESSDESRRRSSSSGGSDSDSSVDDRRQRLLAKRREAKQNSTKANSDNILVKERTSTPTASIDKRSKPVRSSSSGKKKKDSSSSSASSGSSSGGSSGTSSSGESSSEEDDPQIVKPLFVPKHRRNLVASQEDKDKEDEKRRAMQEEETEKRKLEAKLMVAQVVAGVAHDRALTTKEVDLEMDGTKYQPPNDEDPADEQGLELERDAWEIRELRRLLEAQDLIDAEAEEKAEYERRKLMTDEERMIENEALGLHQKPGSSRRAQESCGERKHQQRYYHRGAFYMDQDEWSKDDVRHKAKAYEQAATGDDKLDKSKLPEVMRVKKFGFANASRYKGLAREDTTDTRMEQIPTALLAKGRKRKSDADD